MSKAIMIGAGQIGRGLVGMELEKAGYHVIFADINQEIIDDINARREYTVYIADTECSAVVVSDISAVSSLDPAFPDAFADADVSLVCTSVGLTALAAVAPIIAEGITARMEAGITDEMNIIAVENAVKGTTRLRSCIFEHLNNAARIYAEKYIGFPDSAVDRIIPQNKPGANPADVVVERYSEWDVEKHSIKAKLLPIAGLSIVDDLSAYLERKLFTLNGPNAVTACLGYLKGYTTVNEALADKEIYDVVWGMMEECGAMLEKRYAFTSKEMLDYRTKLMQRFENPYIIDSVTRVAREPIRKLFPNDRIIAAMSYAHEYGIETPSYYTGIAAMLLYDNPEDMQSVELHKMLRERGIEETLKHICGLDENSEATEKIRCEYTRIKNYIHNKE